MNIGKSFLLAATLLASALTAREMPEKKLIHFGWNTPEKLQHFQAPLADLEETAPFDGIGIYLNLTLKRDGKDVHYSVGRALGSPQMLREEDFAEWIPAIKRLQQTRLKHNFIRTGSVLFNADWFDDEAWKRTLNNFSMLAWLAKQADCKGISFDIEAYDFSGRPFKYRPELGHSFKETEAQVRKRAQEWIAELNRQFPGLTLFTFYWTAQCASKGAAMHPELQNSSNTGLQIAFFNGVYDAAPDNMKIVDGNENPGYNAAFRQDYERIVSNYYRFGDGWIDDKNLAKYHKITSLGFALYLDSYVPRENAKNWNLFERTPNPVKLLQANVSNCIEYSDEYVWIWAEQGTFWPRINVRKNTKYWNDRLPFAREAIEAGKSPDDAALKNVTGENLLKNGELEVGESGANEGPGQTSSGIKGWFAWQSASKDKGEIRPENGGVRFVAVSEASLAQQISGIKPGEKFIITARFKNESEVLTPFINAFYRDGKGQGLWQYNRQMTETRDLQDGWKLASLFLEVPDDERIERLTVCCSVNGAGKATPKGDKGCLFDDVILKRISFPWDNQEKK